MTFCFALFAHGVGTIVNAPRGPGALPYCHTVTTITTLC